VTEQKKPAKPAGTKTILVRRAEPRDCVNIAKLLSEGWNEQTVEYAPVDDLRGYRWILDILEVGFVAVADLSGRIVGAAGLAPYRPAWSQSTMLELEFLYILPAFRGEDVAKELIRSVEAFADKVEMSMTFTIATGDRPVIKDRMMRNAGWTYVGGNFLRPANGQGQQTDNDE